MPEVSKLGVGWSGLLDQLTECVKVWRPPLLKREIDYSRLLAAYVRECLPPDSHVETEYRHAGETIDVYVRYSGILSNDEVFLEVKRCLTRKTELSRLVGQVMGLGPEKNKILLVLIGSCDVELVGRLRAQLRKHIEHGPLIVDVPKLRIVEIPEATVM
ncbi:MAG: hypothetical protein WDO68_01930 [Gammaproteobacteria bacterium]